MLDYQVGDIIEYRPFGGGIRRVRVTAKHADVKNGKPGFDGELLEGQHALGHEVWGYNSQVVSV
jgi:hypothetical protein